MSGKGKGGKGGRGAGKKSVSKSAKAGLQFPVARTGRFLKKVSLDKMPFWLSRPVLNCEIVATALDNILTL